MQEHHLCKRSQLQLALDAIFLVESISTLDVAALMHEFVSRLARTVAALEQHVLVYAIQLVSYVYQQVVQ